MKYVVFDIETTGLDTMNDRIIEIGAVKVENREIIETFEQLINPGISIPLKITKITGIDDTLLEDAHYPGVVLTMFKDFIKDVDFIIGHNAKRFDYPFLESEYRRNAIRFEGITCKDTIWEAKRRFRRLPGYSLARLCNHFGIVNRNAHRALSDVYATHELFLKLTEHDR